MGPNVPPSFPYIKIYSWSTDVNVYCENHAFSYSKVNFDSNFKLIFICKNKNKHKLLYCKKCVYST